MTAAIWGGIVTINFDDLTASWMVYINILLYGLPSTLMEHLLVIKISSVQLMSCTHKCEHLTYRLQYKILVYTYKALYWTAPQNLTSHCLSYPNLKNCLPNHKHVMWHMVTSVLERLQLPYRVVCEGCSVASSTDICSECSQPRNGASCSAFDQTSCYVSTSTTLLHNGRYIQTRTPPQPEWLSSI